ncbi:twin-arginine translocase subunit TatC [Candidatus Omnitrophota bacterium]
MISGLKKTFVEHLEELRGRIIKSVIFIIITTALIFSFSDKILSFISRGVDSLVFIAPQEAFLTTIKIALFGGLYLSSPFILYQVWQFVSSGLESSEKKYALIFGFFSFILFLLGSIFGYLVIVPIGMRFLISFGSEFLTPMISIGKYITFLTTLCFAFGLVFQLPVAILFLTKIGIITPKLLRERRKYAVIIIFIIGAIFTPPDIVTQCLMAVPLIALYELSILLSTLVRR